MDRLESPIYFDTNVFIYSIEGHEDYAALLEQIFNQIFEDKLDVFTSELTLAECLVKPVKDNNDEAIQQYEIHIQDNSALTVKPVTRNILKRSAHVRSELGLKLPDAIHMATAIEQGCKTFITNDRKLKAPEGMKQIYLKDLLDSDTPQNS
uniref:PIN domain-containing protein n=1 Tax=uncultured Thiotrichaceae bacterium TaxID=298394 RepID=A0A6S6TCG7_9GAMM|nr:MAG: PIN domain-containing protein [uncultured Thiotrichaceae bacterium]